MTELGVMSGDPCAADSWDHDQRVRAMAYWHARNDGVKWSIAPPSVHDLWRLLWDLSENWPGFRNLLHRGVVYIGGYVRG